MRLEQAVAKLAEWKTHIVDDETKRDDQALRMVVKAAKRYLLLRPDLFISSEGHVNLVRNAKYLGNEYGGAHLGGAAMDKMLDRVIADEERYQRDAKSNVQNGGKT